MVSPQTECYSACALIWLSGPRRYLSPDSVIGVHAAFRTRDGETPEESGVANARIGAFLNMIGLPLDAITYITTAPPDATLPITPAIARNLGIEVYEQHGMETVTPDAAPTAHVLARQTAELGAIAGQCSELLQLDPGAVRQAMEATLGKAPREASAVSVWGKLSVGCHPRSEPMSSAMALRSGVLRRHRASGQRVCPSDSTGRASTALVRPRQPSTFSAMIASLWGPDRAISALYSVHRERATSELKARLKDTQRSWIAWRDGCEADTACVTEAYRQRSEGLRARVSRRLRRLDIRRATQPVCRGRRREKLSWETHRFRQSFQLFPGVRLNISKSGISTSQIGGPGVKKRSSFRGEAMRKTSIGCILAG